MDFHRFKDMDLADLIHNFGLTNIHTFGPTISLNATEWVDYVEEPMKYQALRPHFFSVVGVLEGYWGGWVLVG